MEQPLKLNTDTGTILDKENTFRHVMATMLPGIDEAQVYTMTGAQVAQLVHDIVYYAHGNGRARERQVSSQQLKFK